MKKLKFFFPIILILLVVSCSSVSFSIRVNVTGNGLYEISPYKEKYEDGEDILLKAFDNDDWIFDHWVIDETDFFQREVSIKYSHDLEIDLVFENISDFKYVSPDGNDTDSGSFQNPWKSISKSVKKLLPGDTLIILEGEYLLRDYLDIIQPNSGEEDKWIKIIGEKDKDVIIKGSNNLITGFDLSGCEYVLIENLEITHDDSTVDEKSWFRDAIGILGEKSNDIILKDLYIHHIDEFGINIKDVENMEITDCKFEYCGFGAIGGPSSQEGIKNLTVKGCLMSYSGHYYRNNLYENPYGRPDGIGLEPSAGPINIINCKASHNKGDGFDVKAENCFIDRCISSNNSCDGIKIWGDNSTIQNCLIYGTGDGVGGASPWAGIVIDNIEKEGASFRIINTTLHDNQERESYMMYSQYSGGANINIEIVNSIFSGGYGAIFFGENVNLKIDNSLIFRPQSQEQIYANGRSYKKEDFYLLGNGLINENPYFVLPAWGEEGDYHLLNNSPCIDSGKELLIPLYDLENNVRPSGNGFDMGAYEK